jgi:hypothetical protein
MILSILIYPIYKAPQTRRRIAPALAMAVSARLVSHFLIAFFVISGFRARFSIPGRTRFQLALPHYPSAMGGNLAERHS